jgi:Na+/glutamate symporter
MDSQPTLGREIEASYNRRITKQVIFEMLKLIALTLIIFLVIKYILWLETKVNFPEFWSIGK